MAKNELEAAGIQFATTIVILTQVRLVPHTQICGRISFLT